MSESADRPRLGDAHHADRHLNRLATLRRELTYAYSLAEILRMAADESAKLLHAEKAILMLADDEGLLRVRAAYGVPGEVVSRFRASFDESLAERLQGLFGTSRGFLGVPLVAQGRVIGLLAVLRRVDGDSESDDEWLLSALADQMAAPLENAQLAEKLDRAALLEENARLYESERAARVDAERARGEAEEQRREAEAANRAKSDFIANMSHELRTPLNAIGGYVELMEMGLRGEVTEAQREDLRRIHQAQRVLLALINDVLNFAKLEGGHLEFDIADVPLDENLATLEALIMPQLVAHSLTCEYARVDSRLTVRADGEKLQQILLNLLSNAIKYTPSAGTISMSARFEGDSAFIDVRDTGRGIAPDKLEQIFAPFVRVDTGYARVTEGTGLGLAISRDLARKMGGDLTVRSLPGEGSTFTVRLPKGRR